MISIITINYNGLSLTRQMIASVKEHSSSEYELIVVDNGSTENEVDVLKSEFPWIKCIRSEKNLGFAGANNLGIAQAEGEYIFLLNNDTVIEEDTFGCLCETLDGNDRIAIVSPKIRFASGNRLIQFAGYTPLSKITLRNSLKGFGKEDDGSFDKASFTPFAHGAAMMIKADIIKKVGLMPEIYFLYYEELDWSEMFVRAGYLIAYDPRCTVFHKESGTIGDSSYTKIYYLSRNRLLFGWRNRAFPTRLLVVLYQICIAAPKNEIVYCAKGKWNLAKAVCRGTMDFFKIKEKFQ